MRKHLPEKNGTASGSGAMDGFLQNIGWLCKKYETAHRGLRIVRRTCIKEQEIQNPLVKPAILGVIREAFDNATRHSGADRVHLWLGLWGDHVRVVIEDNGVGFDPKPFLLAGEGRGLEKIRELTDLSGGSFLLGSIKGSGTTVEALWPWENGDGEVNRSA